MQWRLFLALLTAALLGAGAQALIQQWQWPIYSLLVLALPLYGLSGQLLEPLRRLLRALEGAVLSYRDGDFSMSIAAGPSGPLRQAELAALLRAHQELGLALREQRQQLARRELLLDTVVQNTPLALLLLQEPGGEISYANIAARQLLARGRSLAGLSLASLLDDSPETLRLALASGQDQVFGISENGQEELFHLSQRSLQLQGQPHRLLLLRRMTRELSRQEVASWKRVIRVISHELNNSLAPISSLSHSGAELARRGQTERLEAVFASIGERSRQLHRFLAAYAEFAKLPSPHLQSVDWPAFLAGLLAQHPYRLEGAEPTRPARFDPGQLAQALINLLKNAQEAGGPPEAVSLAVEWQARELCFVVRDRGCGMSEAVLAQALLPFYSTKRSGGQHGGSGLGLALAREIAEAHGGRIGLSNREGGGLEVRFCLPQ
ncbi:sensor histidine kinase [Paucibacter sp. B51]|uniref:sensor histidine kinase n=1 Tax=Paucibacter sp. B51 TaxID=2993315 RepID=UPI0022EBFF41|nr:sensor histidine kinase [Paucibacter sp. B51]